MGSSIVRSVQLLIMKEVVYVRCGEGSTWEISVLFPHLFFCEPKTAPKIKSSEKP